MNGKTVTKIETLTEVINRTGEITFDPANIAAWQDELARIERNDLYDWYHQIDNYAQTRLYLVITRVLALAEVMELSAMLHGDAGRIKVLEEKLRRAQQASTTHYRQMVALERRVADLEAMLKATETSLSCQVAVNADLFRRAEQAEAKLQAVREAMA